MKLFKIIFHHKNNKMLEYEYIVSGNSKEEAINNICSCGCYHHNIKENLVSVEETKYMEMENKINLCKELKKLFGYNKCYSFYKAHIECDKTYEKEVKNICNKYGAIIKKECYKFNQVLQDEKIVLYCFDIVNY